MQFTHANKTAKSLNGKRSLEGLEGSLVFPGLQIGK